MRKELTLRELQIESLKILKDVHSFCNERDIKYSVAYGTLIGAIRHKGFIPWDDDIDIIMPRPDYERFCATYKSERYKFKCRQNDEKCFLAYGRVYDDKVTTSETMIPWCSENGGVWIDIFPVDTVSDVELAYKKHKKELWRKWIIVTISRAAAVGFDKNKPLDYNVRLLAKKILTLDGLLTTYLLDSFMKKAKSVMVDNSSHWSQVTCMDGYEWHKTEDFSSTIMMPFEDTEVMVMNGYDNVLRECYGDYMQLPPEEQRVGHSDGLTMFYWKEKVKR